MIPIFKTRYSLARSILDISEELKQKEGGADNIIQIALDHGLKEVVLVEDNMSCFILAYNACRKHGLKLRFGLRLSFCSDATQPKADELHKNIVFLKKSAGYENLVKISTFAATHPFEGEPVVDYDFFHKHRDGLELVVPYFDSYLYRNNTEFAACIPQFRDLNPIHLLERNELPTDQFIEPLLAGKSVVLAKSIFYKNRDDIHIFTTRKLMEKSGGKRRNLECPNLENFCSSEFCWESYQDYMNKH